MLIATLCAGGGGDQPPSIALVSGQVASPLTPPALLARQVNPFGKLPALEDGDLKLVSWAGGWAGRVCEGGIREGCGAQAWNVGPSRCATRPQGTAVTEECGGTSCGRSAGMAVPLRLAPLDSLTPTATASWWPCGRCGAGCRAALLCRARGLF
jgi:hypothetical protein